ncbi:MAG: CBS domain-containing protein, partial [Anaerolineaceae bacterium]|nr:CBS domain-containing protein [Anaerolineaceae bacterium]
MLVRERMISTGTRVSANVPISSLNGNFDNISSSWVPVVDQEGSLVGLLTVADLKTAKETIKKLPPEDRSGPTVRDFMTTKFLFVNENTPIEEAVRMMIDYDTDELPVVKDGYFSGVITEKIMLRVLMEITGARRQGIRLMVEV